MTRAATAILVSFARLHPAGAYPRSKAPASVGSPGPYTYRMTAHPESGSTRVTPPERSPAGIRAELPEELRVEFDAEYLAALDEARSTFRLDRLEETIRSWWLFVWVRRSPGHQQALETGRRILAGEPVQTFPVDLDALRNAR